HPSPRGLEGRSTVTSHLLSLHLRAARPWQPCSAARGCGPYWRRPCRPPPPVPCLPHAGGGPGPSAPAPRRRAPGARRTCRCPSGGRWARRRGSRPLAASRTARSGRS
ncbi:unnamed protein product, partial [Prorocentrum cordatum]